MNPGTHCRYKGGDERADEFLLANETVLLVAVPEKARPHPQGPERDHVWVAPLRKVEGRARGCMIEVVASALEELPAVPTREQARKALADLRELLRRFATVHDDTADEHMLACHATLSRYIEEG